MFDVAYTICLVVYMHLLASIFYVIEAQLAINVSIFYLGLRNQGEEEEEEDETEAREEAWMTVDNMFPRGG